ncbi:MAG: D-Ala-D-Ala carboxypeptidase family metallohydrolase [Rhodospirillales bacterium]
MSFLFNVRHVLCFLLPALALLAGQLAALPASAAAPCSARLPSDHLKATVNGLDIDLALFSVFVMPGEELRIAPSRPALATADRGDLMQTDDGVWRWVAPPVPGLSKIELTDNGEDLTLHAFVMRPAADAASGTIDGYRIGLYPRKPYRGLDAYLPPAGLVEVSKDIAGTRLTPLFTIGQFLSKQQSGWPKFIVLREELLLKLHRVAELVDAAGFDSCGIVIMSGYRTPFYNAAIGNGRHSRHVYGGAADIYLDSNPRDGVMDDLNGDGRINKKDAAVLFDLVDEASRNGDWDGMHGGLGEYGANAAHGPFVHIDSRGFRARWGR